MQHSLLNNKAYLCLEISKRMIKRIFTAVLILITLFPLGFGHKNSHDHSDDSKESPISKNDLFPGTDYGYDAIGGDFSPYYCTS